MKEPRNTQPPLLAALGSLFLFIGLFTLLNVLVGLHLGHVILWRSVVFAAMDLTVSYGFFSNHRWLLYAFSLNALGQALLVSLHWYHAGMGKGFLLSLLGITATLLIAGYTYHKRRILVHNNVALYTGVGFFLLWGISFVYTVSSLL